MKIKITFISILAMLVSCYSFTQQLCGLTAEAMELIPCSEYTISGGNSSQVISIPLYIYAVGRANGSDAPSESLILEAVSLLKNLYRPYGIYFDVTFIKAAFDNNMFNNYKNGNNVNYVFTQNTYYCPYGLTIYMYKGNTGGSVNKIWGDRIFATVYHTDILAHEIGHALGLLHTHECYCGYECAVDLEFCETTGDLVCDTRADYDKVDFAGKTQLKNSCSVDGHKDHEESSCNISNNCPGDLYDPLFDNIMSYYPKELCGAALTLGQANRIRGSIYKITNQEEFSLVEAEISQNTTWNSNRIIRTNIYIKSGSTLTIQNCTISMAPGKSIIVERGGTLSVQGSTLTLGLVNNYCELSSEEANFWGGIKCDGFSSNNGISTININQSNIILAYCGVSDGLTRVDRSYGNFPCNLTCTGNSSFINNPTGIDLSNPDSNLKFFNCSMITNSNIPSVLLITGIKLYRQKYASIILSEFENSVGSTSITTGIDCVGSFAKVQGGLIKGYHSGFIAWTFSDIRPYNLLGVRIEDCFWGVQNNNIDNFLINSCNFEVGKGNNPSPSGIRIQRGTGFSMTNNTFIKSPNQSAGNGIFIEGTSIKDINIIGKNNTFRNVTNGIYSKSVNDQLFIACNKNENNIKDINVDVNSTLGSPQKYLNGPAGNEFTQTGTYDIQNQNALSLQYYYNSTIPKHYPTNVQNVERFISTSTVNNCINRTGPDFPKTHIMEGLTNNENQVNLIQSYLNNFLDGGQTQQIISNLNNMIQFDSSYLNYLNNLAPNISVKVASNILNRNDIFSDLQQLQLLQQNPNLILISTNYIQLKNLIENNINQEILTGLSNLTLSESNRTTLELDLLSAYQAYTEDISAAIIKLYSEDTIIGENSLGDSIIILLNKIKSVDAYLDVSLIFLQKDNISAANSCLDQIQNLISVDDYEIIEIQQFRTYINFIASIRTSGRSLAELDSTEITYLYNFAIQSNSKACQLAKNLLIYFYGYEFGNNYLLSKKKSHESYRNGLSVEKPELFENFIRVYPNPFKEKLNISLPDNLVGKSLSINISDIYGHKLFDKIINFGSNYYECNFEKDFSGLLYITIQSNQTTIYKSKLIKI